MEEGCSTAQRSKATRTPSVKCKARLTETYSRSRPNSAARVTSVRTQLAFDACGKAGLTIVIPSPLLRGAVSFASHLGRRSRDLLQFFADGLTQEAVGQQVGEHHLADYFRDLCAIH